MPEKGTLNLSVFRLLVLIVSLFIGYSTSFAQTKDSVSAQKLSVIDSTKPVKAPPSTHSPAKAMIYSAILPGLGQAYNHKYWKIPIVYAGLGAMAYFIVYNQQQFNIFKTALNDRTLGEIDPFYNIYSASDLVSIRDSYHRYRDLSVIGATLWYVLNIVDAEVDAQLFSFNVSDDLSMQISPALVPTCGVFNATPGLSIALKFK